MLCTWARDYGINGTGVDMNRLFSRQAELRAQLTSEPERYAAYMREYLGWGVCALMPR